MKNRIQADTEELNRLQERLNEAYKKWRAEGDDAHKDAWHAAAEKFRQRYGQVAFPDATTSRGLTAGEPEAIEKTVRFLEADPFSFRSGYMKVDLIKILRKHPLTPEQGQRLRQVILQRVHGKPVREMRAYCGLACKVTTPEFETELSKIAESGGSQAARHATWVLERIRQSRTAQH